MTHFNTSDEEYAVIFTSGATAAIKIVGENFIWGRECTAPSQFVYTKENHTSVLGIRACAAEKNILASGMEVKEIKKKLLETPLGIKRKREVVSRSLFAYSAQCNYSGAKNPLEWIEAVQGGALSQSGNWLLFIALFILLQFLVNTL